MSKKAVQAEHPTRGYKYLETDCFLYKTKETICKVLIKGDKYV
jgi:hypothetical protein